MEEAIVIRTANPVVKPVSFPRYVCVANLISNAKHAPRIESLPGRDDRAISAMLVAPRQKTAERFSLGAARLPH
jgi:hypothetical protein